MREIALYRQKLDKCSMDEFNAKLARFGDETELSFKEDFPRLHPDTFRLSPLWLALVGTGVKPELSSAAAAEVEPWLENRIANFFGSL